MDETQGKVRHLSLTLTWAAGMVLAMFFVFILIGAAPALVIGAALAGTVLLALVFMPGGVYDQETRAMNLAGSPGIPAPRPFGEAKKKAYAPFSDTPPPPLTPAI